VGGSSVPSGPRPIGLRLRQLREAAGITQTALSTLTGIRQGRLSELELAARMPTADLVNRYLDGLSVSADVRQDVLDELIEHRSEAALWRRLHRAGLRQHQQRYAQTERAATVIREWADFVVPGLLQTADYTRAMVAARANPAITDVEGIVAGRAERQEVLRERSKRFAFLIGEPALRPTDISPEVMEGQLDAILLAAAASHVEVGVLPVGAMLPATSFLILDTSTVMIELETRQLTIQEADEIARYVAVFDLLSRQALRGDTLADLVRAIRRDLGDQRT
jgi:transcriptional regulator with XRE-family HTH domain